MNDLNYPVEKVIFKNAIEFLSSKSQDDFEEFLSKFKY